LCDTAQVADIEKYQAMPEADLQTVRWCPPLHTIRVFPCIVVVGPKPCVLKCFVEEDVVE
jgi:hypothetical protein